MDALRRRIILAAANTPTPERVAYIRGGGDGSYIDTGIKPTENTRIVVWARNWVPYSEHLLGSRTSQSVDEFTLCAPSGVAVDRLRFKFAINEVYLDGAIIKCFSNYHKYEINGNQLFIDDELRLETIADPLTSNFNVYLFGLNNGGTFAGLRYPADIIACKIYQDDVLVRDLTPVRTPSVGFYDSVTNTLFSNAGDGELIYNEYNPYAYKPLKYVSSTAEQYAETGIIGGYSVPFVAQVAAKADVPKWNIPVSGRYNANKRCEYFFGNTSTANYNLSAGYSGGTSQVSTDGFYGVKLNLTKSGNTFNVYKDNVQLGTQKTFNTDTGYTTNQPFVIGGTFENEAFKPSESFDGDIYYAGFGRDGNYVPAMVGGVAGFYDTYSDKFHESKTDKPFVPGPDLVSDDSSEGKTIPYIRGGNDGSYIDTGIVPDSSTSVIVWARNFNPGASSYTWFFGSRVSSTASCFDVYSHYGRYTGRIGVVYSNNQPIAVDGGWKCFTDYHKYELKKGSLFVDDECVVSKGAGQSFSTSHPIHLIGYNNNGTHGDSNMRIDICACQIYKGGELVRDFTPKQENGVIGLYDSVSNTLFTNAGTGNFEYGTFNTKAYTRLEYVTTAGASYFDSGVYGEYTDDFVVKYMPTDRTPMWHGLFGCRPAANVFEVALGTTGTGNDNKAVYCRMGLTSGGTYHKTVNTASLTGNEVIVVKEKNSGRYTIVNESTTARTQYSTTITGVSATFVSDTTLGICASKTDNVATPYHTFLRGRLYYFRLSMKRSLVPAIVNGTVGMYDTYNDQFYSSITETPFIAGPKRMP